MKIARARPEDADALTKIAIEAKSHWGYPPSWIRQWKTTLTITSEYICVHPTYAAMTSEKIVGVCAVNIKAEEAWLDHLWVLPSAMGNGVGRKLFAQAEGVARAAGSTCLKIIGDPHAEGFYRRMGAKIYGQEPAPIDGEARFLPLLEKTL